MQTGKITDAAKIADFIRRKQIGNVLTAITDVSKLRLVVKGDGYENKQTLNIPALTYRGFRGSGNQQCYTGFSYAPGLLNSDFYKDLGPTDSVIVAKKQIVLSLALPQ